MIQFKKDKRLEKTVYEKFSTISHGKLQIKITMRYYICKYTKIGLLCCLRQ